MESSLPTHISAASPGELLALLRLVGGLTRQELLERTGMSRSTLTGRLDQLSSAGFVFESRQRTSTGGRPAAVLACDERDAVVLSVDVGHHRTTVSLHGLDGTALGATHLARGGDAIDKLIPEILAAGDAHRATHPTQRLLGIGLALPAPVNARTGRVLTSVGLPDSEYPAAASLAAHFGVDVIVENDARALAVGASTEVPDLDDDDVFLGVKFSTGLGLGIIVGGTLMRGTSGAAGDLGHLQVTPGQGPICTCGRRGCLAAYAAGRAIIRDLERPDIVTVDDLAAAYDAGERGVIKRVHQAADMLGQQLGGLVQVTNPRYVAFGGFLGERPAVADRMRDLLRDSVADRIDGAAEFRVVDGHLTTASGLVRLVADHVFDPERIDAHLARIDGAART